MKLHIKSILNLSITTTIITSNMVLAHQDKITMPANEKTTCTSTDKTKNSSYRHSSLHLWLLVVVEATCVKQALHLQMLCHTHILLRFSQHLIWFLSVLFEWSPQTQFQPFNLLHIYSYSFFSQRLRTDFFLKKKQSKVNFCILVYFQIIMCK